MSTSSSSKRLKSLSSDTRAWRDWSELPNDILLHISDCLANEPFELRRFRAVCPSWRSSVKPPSRPIFTPVIPIPNFSEEDKKRRRCKACKLFESTLYKVRPIKAPSSSKPLIIKVEEETLRMFYDQDLPNSFHLVDPLSQDLLLPPSFPKVLNLLEFEIREFCKRHVLVRDAEYTRGHKNREIYVPGIFVTSFSHKTTRDDDFVVMGLSSTRPHVVSFEEIIVYRESALTWSKIAMEDALFSDITYYKEKFLIVDCTGKLCAFDPDTLRPTLVANPLANSLGNSYFEGFDGGVQPLYDVYGDDLRLVESNGELFLIDIFSLAQNRRGNSSFSFPFPFPVDKCRVFKLDGHEMQKQWVEVHNLGDRVFLVGLHCSFSLLASDFPQGKPNCIYFTKHRINNPRGEFTHNIGVFDLKNGMFEKLNSGSNYQMFWPSPTWIPASAPK